MGRVIAKILLSLFFLVIIILIVRGCVTDIQKQSEIKHYEGTTICKYTYRYRHNKTCDARVRYYIDGVRYKNRGGECPDNYHEKLKHFYIMRYSTLNPNKIVVDFTQEVTDTVAILKAGFSMEELGRDPLEKGERSEVN